MTKEELDKFSVLCQQRAADATKSGRFNSKIVPLQVRVQKGKEVEIKDEMHTKDEGIRAATYDATAKLKPMYKNGIITPATSSQICDGAAAVMVCNEDGLKKLGIRPKAKIAALTVVGADPVIMLE